MRQKTRKADEFLCGFAAALSILQAGWHEHGLVCMVLHESGFEYDDLRRAGVGAYDLKLIRQAHKSDHRPLRRARKKMEER